MERAVAANAASAEAVSPHYQIVKRHLLIIASDYAQSSDCTAQATVTLSLNFFLFHIQKLSLEWLILTTSKFLFSGILAMVIPSVIQVLLCLSKN